MGAIRSTENRSERALRHTLHAMGLRYRKYRRDLPGAPDLVLAGPRIVVFVDGDYWHARVVVEGGEPALQALLRRMPSPRRAYWREKFRRRVERDRSVSVQLRAAGWTVMRFWESDVKRDVVTVAETIFWQARASDAVSRDTVSRSSAPGSER